MHARIFSWNHCNIMQHSTWLCVSSDIGKSSRRVVICVKYGNRKPWVLWQEQSQCACWRYTFRLNLGRIEQWKWRCLQARSPQHELLITVNHKWVTSETETSVPQAIRGRKWWLKNYRIEINNLVESFDPTFTPSIGAGDDRPVDVFLQLFLNDLIEVIVFQTNLYAMQHGNAFPPTNVQEIKTPRHQPLYGQKEVAQLQRPLVKSQDHARSIRFPGDATAPLWEHCCQPSTWMAIQ